MCASAEPGLPEAGAPRSRRSYRRAGVRPPSNGHAPARCGPSGAMRRVAQTSAPVGTRKSDGHHTDHPVDRAVEPQIRAEHVFASRELAFPESLTDDHDRRRAVLVRLEQRSPEPRLNPERFEERGRDTKAGELLWRPVARVVRIPPVDGGEAVEDVCCLLAPVEEVTGCDRLAIDRTARCPVEATSTARLTPGYRNGRSTRASISAKVVAFAARATASTRTTVADSAG